MANHQTSAWYNEAQGLHGWYRSIPDEPCDLHDALNSPDWKQAMDVEFDALQKNRTWHLVPPKSGSNVIDCK
jgi:hypothetical protein